MGCKHTQYFKDNGTSAPIFHTRDLRASTDVATAIQLVNLATWPNVRRQKLQWSTHQSPGWWWVVTG